MIEHVFKSKLQRPAIAISAPDLQLIIDAHPARTSAGKATSWLRPSLRWAAKRGLMQPGIAEALELPEGIVRPRQRVLAPEEIRAILNVVHEFGVYGDALRWLFRTACRLNEACLMRWRDVDLGSALWVIPTTKQNRPHIVPLSRQALAMLRARATDCRDPDDLVFANPNTGHQLSHWDRTTKRIQARSGTSGWHRHDLRRTAATILGDTGTLPHVVEIVLGHALSKSSDGQPLSAVAAVYNRSPYRREHADALQRLADELDRIEADRPKTNVVPLRA
jgi:integrase